MFFPRGKCLPVGGCVGLYLHRWFSTSLALETSNRSSRYRRWTVGVREGVGWLNNSLEIHPRKINDWNLNTTQLRSGKSSSTKPSWLQVRAVNLPGCNGIKLWKSHGWEMKLACLGYKYCPFRGWIRWVDSYLKLHMSTGLGRVTSFNIWKMVR